MLLQYRFGFPSHVLPFEGFSIILSLSNECIYYLLQSCCTKSTPGMRGLPRARPAPRACVRPPSRCLLACPQRSQLRHLPTDTRTCSQSEDELPSLALYEGESTDSSSRKIYWASVRASQGFARVPRTDLGE